MKNRRKYRIHLRTHLALEAILILCSSCLLSCALVVAGTVIFFHGEWTLPVVIILCLLVCSLTMVVGGIALYYGMAFFVKPIEEMNRVVNRIAKGDFAAQISRKQRDGKSAEYPILLDDDFALEGIKVGDTVLDSSTDIAFTVAGFVKDEMYGHVSIGFISIDRKSVV